MRGYSTDQIETVMNALKNSSAFGRQASLTMGQAVQSATEGLKNENSILVDNAGVTKNVSMMWKDYAASIGTTVGALTKEQKIAAEVQGILEETRFQMGDAAKLSGTYAGQVSALGVSFMNLKVAIGNSIIPMINLALPYIKAAIDALVIFFNQVAQIMNLLFGTNVSMANAMNDVADSTGDAADAQGDLADNTQDATRAAKGALAAFDQLNVLQSTDTNTNGGSTTPPIDQITLPPIDDTVLGAGLNALEERVLRFKTKFLEFISPVVQSLDDLRVALTPLGETIWAGLKWAWDNILVPLGAWFITDLLPVFLDLLGSAGELLNSILIALEPSWTWFWENVLKPLAEWTGGVIVDFIGWLADRLLDLSSWMDEHGESVVLVIEIIAGIAGALWLLNAAVGAINVAIGIYNSAMAIAAVVTGALTLPVLLVIALIVALVVLIYLLITNWEELVTTVKQLLFILGYYIDNYFFKPLVDGFEKALDWIEEKFTTIFESIKGIVKGVINSIIDFINGMIDSVIGGINSVVGAANLVGNIIPGYSPIPFLESPQIPHLATGAVIPPNAQFAAILGDQRSGRNLEAPEGLIRQIISEEIGKIQADIRISFEGSLGALVRELKPHIDRENVRVGGSLIKSGTTL